MREATKRIAPTNADHEVLMLLFTSLLFDGRVQKEACTLREAGYRVTILHIPDPASEESLDDPAAAWAGVRAQLRGITDVPVFLATKRLRWLPQAMRRPIQALELFARFLPHVLSHRWHAIHAHELSPAVFAIVGRLFLGSHIVYDSHELEVAESDERAKPVRLRYERITLRLSSVVMTVNAHIASLLSARSRRNVYVVANRPAEVPASALRPGTLHPRLGLAPGSKIVMYVGNLAPWERGVEVTAEALNHLPSHVHFVIMGVGRVAEFKAHFAQLPFVTPELKLRVHFIDPVSPDRVPIVLSDADISVMLYRAGSANETFNSPNKLYQSILAQVPILASRNATFPPVVEGGSSGGIGLCCDPQDTMEIAGAVEQLLAPDFAAKCRMNAAKESERVSWQQSARELLEAYESLSTTPAD